jgi:hypothetical protein
LSFQLTATASKRQRTMPRAANKLGDNFPNYLSFELEQTAANTWTDMRLAMPIPRITGGMGTKATIMELLWVDFSFDNIDLGSQDDRVTFAMGTGATPETSPQIEFDNPNVLFEFKELYHFTRVGDGASGTLASWPKRYDFQSKTGYGFLVASDNLWVIVSSVGMAGALTVQARLFYRFVDVDVKEYVGIVQSSQQY